MIGRLRWGCSGMALGAALVGCSADPNDRTVAWQGTIDTLPSGTVVVSNPKIGVWDSASGWRLEENLRIGAAEGDGPDVFSDVHDLAVDDAGNVYVLQRTTKVVTVFDDSGQFVRTIGRQGGGPGEFENPNGVAMDPIGRFWVADPQSARYTAFDTTGAVVASHPRTLASRGWMWDGVFMADGRLVERSSVPAGADLGNAYIRFDSAFAPVDTLLRTGPVPAMDDLAFVLRSGGSTAYVAIPFTPGAVAVLDPRGYLWTGESGPYRLVQRALDGDTARIITREYDPVPVLEADLVEVREQYEQYITHAGWDESRIPDVKPAFAALSPGPDGSVYVRRERPHGDSVAVFDVFDPDGRYLGELNAPVGLAERPLWVGNDALYGVVRDELDIPHVVRLRIVRPGAG